MGKVKKTVEISVSFSVRFLRTFTRNAAKIHIRFSESGRGTLYRYSNPVHL